MSALTVDDPVLAAFAEELGTSGSIAIEGTRSRWDMGGPLADGTRVVAAPAGIVSYRPEEMTVQVRAGTTVAELHAELATKGQRSSLPERGTVGGAVAVGENGLHRLGRGSVRDAVLQVRYVAADGEIVTGGGPVVKNVSGFNIPKLMVGSLGTLGSIVEVVVRTNPTPAVSLWLQAEGVDPTAAYNATLRPSAVLYDGAATWVQLEGHAADVAAEQRQLSSLGAFAEVEGPPPLPPYRWSCSPAEASRFAHDDAFVASIGVGTVWASIPQPPAPTDPTVELVSNRMKQLFDPTGRLNPGRRPGR